MDKINQLEQEIIVIKERNSRVEADKAWETSFVRKISIAILTYAVVVIFFYFIKLENPWINAIVPTMGFLLSTISIGILKIIDNYLFINIVPLGTRYPGFTTLAMPMS